MGRRGTESQNAFPPWVTLNHAILPLRILPRSPSPLGGNSDPLTQHQWASWLLSNFSSCYCSPLCPYGPRALTYTMILVCAIIIIFFDLHVFIHLCSLLEKASVSLSLIWLCLRQLLFSPHHITDLPGKVFVPPHSLSCSSKPCFTDSPELTVLKRLLTWLLSPLKVILQRRAGDESCSLLHCQTSHSVSTW